MFLDVSKLSMQHHKPPTNAVADGIEALSPAGDTQKQHQPEKKKQPRKRRSRTSADGGGALWPRKRRLTEEQARMLEMSFGAERGLDTGRKFRLAKELGLDPRQVAVWFQNRRARWREKRIQEEYAGLNAALEDTVLDNMRLEAQILDLRQQVGEVQQKLGRLSATSTAKPLAQGGGTTVSSGGSPMCSATALVDSSDITTGCCYHQPVQLPMLLEELREEEEEELLWLGGGMENYSMYDNGIWDWTHL